MVLQKSYVIILELAIVPVGNMWFQWEVLFEKLLFDPSFD